MGTTVTTLNPGMAWTASPEAVDRELSRVRSTPFFQVERHWLESEKLNIVGVLNRKKEYGGTEQLRIRLVYPDNFPQAEPIVFDHDRVFQPIDDAHQMRDWSLCLTFPPRGEFTHSEETLTSEVLGSAWNWMVKRYIFECNGRKLWPGDAEPHGWAAYEPLVRDKASQTGISLLQIWVEFALSTCIEPKLHAPCPCGSGRRVVECHRELGMLLERAVAVKRGAAR